MNKNKGFTMVELLATIVILSILSTTAIIAVTKVINKARDTKLTQQKNSLEMAAESYAQENRNILPKEIGEEIIIYAYVLKEKNFLKSNIEDSSGRDCTGSSSTKKSYVTIHKYSKTKFNYTATLYCESGSSPDPTNTPTSTPTITINLSGDKLNNTTFNIKITDTKELQSYSYSIIIGDNKEIYNSGTISAEGKNTIDFTKNLKDCINLTNNSDIIIKVTARNVEGSFQEKQSTKSVQLD